MRIIGCFLLAIIFPALVNAEDVKARMAFMSDTTAVGKPVTLLLAISHPSDEPIIFPIQNKRFRPFEYVSHKAIPTRTVEGISYDSAYYKLRTFNLDSIQQLSLLYKVVRKGDTLNLYTNRDSVKLNYRFQEGSPTITFRSMEEPIEMKDPPNYALIILLTVSMLVLMVGLFYVLKAPIRRQIMLSRARNDFRTVLGKLNLIKSNGDWELQLTELNDTWKSYLDPHTAYGLKAMSTTDLKEKLDELYFLSPAQHQNLVEMSVLYDRAIYAGQYIQPMEVSEAIDFLLPILEQEYERRREEIIQSK
ncbi:MAG: hypothetical protein AAFY71_21045 [Bacteroidota bacterium]